MLEGATTYVLLDNTTMEGKGPGVPDFTRGGPHKTGCWNGVPPGAMGIGWFPLLSGVILGTRRTKYPRKPATLVCSVLNPFGGYFEVGGHLEEGSHSEEGFRF
jgi:hypothetical protein